MSCIALILAATNAFATPTTQPAARMISAGRASLAVPVGYEGFGTSYSAEIGAQFKSGQSLSLRLAFLPDPTQVYGAATPSFAMGPAVTWAYHVKVAPQLDVSPTVGLGAVFGVSPVDNTNVVLPYLQAGLGMRLRIPMPGDSEFYVMPELGIVPAILAPMIAVNIGVIGKPPPAMPAEI